MKNCIGRDKLFPVLASYDFLLWWYIKDGEFSSLYSTTLKLEISIGEAISSIAEENFNKVVKNTEFRMKTLLRQSQAQFENLSN